MIPDSLFEKAAADLKRLHEFKEQTRFEVENEMFQLLVNQYSRAQPYKRDCFKYINADSKNLNRDVEDFGSSMSDFLHHGDRVTHESLADIRQLLETTNEKLDRLLSAQSSAAQYDRK